MRVYLVASVALLAASPLLIAACGGASASSGAPKTAEPTTATSAAPESDGGALTTSTTTLTLSDAGDLTGSKLETKSTTTAPAADSKAENTHVPHKSEPGRGVDDVRTIITARRDEIRACYDNALRDHPGIAGDVDVKWVIDPKGVVTDIGVDEMKSTIVEPGVRKCITDIIKKIQFAPSAKGFESRMHYPFNFNPRSGGRVGNDAK